jgi:hypothetical protein
MSTSLLLPPNASKRPAGVVFIGLNVVRFISLVSLVLVVAATIAHMVGDFRAVGPAYLSRRPLAQIEELTTSLPPARSTLGSRPARPHLASRHRTLMPTIGNATLSKTRVRRLVILLTRRP